MEIGTPNMISTTTLRFYSLTIFYLSQRPAALRLIGNAHMNFIGAPTIRSPTHHNLRDRFGLRKRSLNRQQIQARQNPTITRDPFWIMQPFTQDLVTATNTDNRNTSRRSLLNDSVNFGPTEPVQIRDGILTAG